MAATVQGILLTGIHAARPSSGLEYGTIYACSTHFAIEQTTDAGATWVTWPGLGTTAPNPTTIELGHASDTTLSRASAGVVAVEGTNLVKAGAATASGLTQATARLLGRTTASTGAIEEITVGSGLSLAAGALTASGSATPPTCKQTFLTADVAIPNANTAQDVLSLSLEAGDWLLYGNAEITSAHTNQTQLTIALHDGTGIVANAQVVQQSGIGGISQHASCDARITLAGTTTVKLQAFSVRGASDSTVKDAATSNGTADKGTSLIALNVTAV